MFMKVNKVKGIYLSSTKISHEIFFVVDYFKTQFKIRRDGRRRDAPARYLATSDNLGYAE